MVSADITQILYLTIPKDRDLGDPKSYYGKLWSAAFDSIEQSEGFVRLYWGRSLEKPDNVQLHIIRRSREAHSSFVRSPAHRHFRAVLQTLHSPGSADPINATRYVAMRDFTPNSRALGRGAPFTGTAIYLSPTAGWHEGAWPLWTHIVRYIDGCMGCSGGELLDPVDLLEDPVLVGEVETKDKEKKRRKAWQGYLVYVGWESVEKHEAYHHTEHFKEHRVILRCGNAGFAEYGHIVFQGGRGGGLEPGARL